jgi:hypothetical protein
VRRLRRAPADREREAAWTFAIVAVLVTVASVIPRRGDPISDFPAGLDPESSGSRFTSRAALAILTRWGGASRFTGGEDVGDAAAVVADALLGEPSESAPARGKCTTIDGSNGRGPAGWVPSSSALPGW